MTMPPPDSPTAIASDSPDPSRPRRRRGGAPTIIAWLVVALAVPFIVWMNSQRATGAPLDAAPPNPAKVSGFQTTLLSRYILGVKYLQEAGGTISDQLLGDLVENQLLNPAADPIYRLRSAVVAGEIIGSERALEVLDDVAANVEAGHQQALSALTAAEQSAAPPEGIAALQEAAEHWAALLQDAAILTDMYTGGPDAALSTAEAERLTTRHHWFGRLARVYQSSQAGGQAAGQASAQAAGPTGTLRQQLYMDGVQTMVALVVGAVVAVIAFLAGIVCFIIAVIQFRVQVAERNFHHGFDPASQPRVIITGVEPFACFLVAFIALQFVGAWLDSIGIGPTALNRSMLAAQWLLLLTIFWPLLRRVSWRELRRGMGWTSGRGVGREIAAGIFGYLAGLPVVAAGILIMFLLLSLTGATPSHPATDGLANAGLIDAILIFLLGVIWAPLVEETIFRGLLYKHLRGAAGVIASALLVAFLFAIIHPQSIVVVPALMSLALVFALLREWRGSLLAPITAHALHNGFLLTMVLTAFA